MTDEKLTALVGRIDKVALGELSQSTVRQIREKFAEYERVPLHEHVRAVREQHAVMLSALSEDRLVSAAQLTTAAELARRRAGQQVPIGALIGAYHIGERELWSRLVASAGESEHGLAEAASIIFGSLQQITMTLASAHSEVTRTRDAHRATLGQRLVELLYRDELSSEATSLGEALGLAPAGAFVVLASRETTESAGRETVGLETADTGGRLAAGSVEGTWYVVAQGVTEESLARLAPPGSRAGVSLPRAGLAGAVQCLRDAELAIGATTRERPVALLRSSWLAAVLHSHAIRLAPMLGHAPEVARDNPHLARTAVAYAANDMSVARTAQDGHLHPNTVRYRLERWHELSGLDPTDFGELVLSVLACSTEIIFR